MKVNAAVGLLLAAAGLPGFTRRSRITGMMGLLLFLLGAATVVEYATGRNFGIDEFFFSDRSAASAGDIPGRMGLNSAWCFVLVGVTYLVASFRIGIARVVALPAAVCLLSVAAGSLVGYATGLEVVYRWGAATRMALPTAVAFLLLGAGLLAAGWREVERRRELWLSIGLGGCVAGITFMVWIGARSELELTRAVELQRGAETIAQTTAASVTLLGTDLSRLDDRWHAACDQPCRDDLRAYLRDLPALNQVGWASPSVGRSTVVARTGAGVVELSPQDARALALVAATLTPAPTPGSLSAALQPGSQLWLYRGRPGSDQWFVAIVDVPVVLARVRSLASRAVMEVSIDGQPIIAAPRSATPAPPGGPAVATASIYGRQWRFAINPATTPLSYASTLLLLVGLLIASFVAATAYLWQTSRSQLAQIHDLNDSLEQRVVDRTRQLEASNQRLEEAIEQEKRAESEILALNQTLESRVQRRTAQLAAANQELAEARTRLQSVLDAATEIAIISANPEGVITLFNAGAERMLQYTAAEMVSRQTPAIIHDPDEFAARSRELSQERGQAIEGFDVIVAVARERAFDEREWTYIRKDGSRLEVNLVVTAVRNDDGQITGYLGIATDITARKRLERALRLKNEQLSHQTERAEEANRAKSAFLAAMSHEIRTPMNAILGMADLLWESPLEKEQRQYVEVFRRAGQNLLALINDILDLSKIEAGRFELEQVAFDLNEVVGQSVELIAPRARAKGLSLSVRQAPDVPNGLLGDPHRLRQVLVNLLGNAVKFTERGAIMLEVANETEDGSRSREDGLSTLSFAVTDTGIGIPPDQLERIFDDFTQADSSTTRRFGGTGLGLGISRRLVDRMHGQLTLKSTPGIGSTFRFTAVFGRGALPSGAPGVTDLRNRRVLLLDDDATNRLVLRETLTAWGMDSRDFEHPRDALSDLAQAADENRAYSLVIVDSQMPEMSGFEAARQIRNIAPHVPVVMLASDAEKGDERRRAEAGVVAFALKPINRPELLRVIGDALTVPATDPDRSLEAPRPLRILVAEDFEDNRLIVEAFLNGSPHTLTFVGDGREAVDRFTREDVDLVLMDVQMPVMDGLEATRLIRDFERAQGRAPTPIVALTANAAPSDVAKALAAGSTAHLSKPISKRALLSAIADAARHGAPADRLRIEVPEGLEELADEYLRTRRRQLPEIQQLLAAGNFDRLRILGHNLAGSGASYGLPRVSELGRLLEDAARTSDREAASRQVAAIEEYLARAAVKT